MSLDISAELRDIVTKRANNFCEYCLHPQAFSLHKHEIDHIIPLQHGGETNEKNLALACLRCNRYKGPNIGSYDPQTGNLVPFFNPREQIWSDHFELKGANIHPLTAEARVTEKILRLNESDRIEERQKLIALGVYKLKI